MTINSPAYEAVCRAIEAQASHTAHSMIKRRARAYALRPRELDALGDDLRSLPPRHLVTALAYIARTAPRYRHFGFGREVPAINLRGAMLYARYLRAAATTTATAATWGKITNACLSAIEEEETTSLGIFRDHTCWKCKDGATPCICGNPRQCEYPHAKND